LICIGDWRAVIHFLWLTGARPGEASKITAEMVDWSAGVVKLKEHKTKHKGKQRMIYLSPDAIELLKSQRDKHKSGYLFRGKKNKPFSMIAFVNKFQRISSRLGTRVTAYGLRHSFATRALERGIPEAQVAAMLGHAGTNMLFKHYSHLTSNARLLREQIAKVSDHVSIPLSPPKGDSPRSLSN
jgi:integrase